MVDVLLVNPYAIHGQTSEPIDSERYPPLGLMVLAALLRDRGYTVEIHDGTFTRGIGALARRMASGPTPRVAGVYALRAFREDALAAIRLIKEQGILCIVGGPDPSENDEHYLREGVDLVVRGEGEEPLLEILRAFAVLPGSDGQPRRPTDERILSIPGISILDRDVEYRRSPDSRHSGRMDDVPSPAYDLVDLGRYFAEQRRLHGVASIQLMTSRGCPFSCTWCARPIFGRKYRQRGPEQAVDEVQALVDRYGIEHLWLFDDTFVVRREWVERFCDELIARSIEVRWDCVARTDLVDRTLLARMRRAGCTRINFGIESGSQRILDGMKKGTTVEDTRRVARDMHALGISMGGYLLFGYPGEEWGDIEQTIELVRGIAPVDYSASVVEPTPGTELHEIVAAGSTARGAPEEDAREASWQAPYPARFYKLVEALLHAEYDLALELTPTRYVEAKLIRALLFALRIATDRARLERYRSERFKGWRGLRKPEHAARHRARHAAKAAAARARELSPAQQLAKLWAVR